MNRDPLFEQILRRLQEISDDQLFEACVNDLLRKEWPNLVPVPGGDDAGVDGAWADNGGKGLLVATTGGNVLENVTKNLKKHLETGGDRRRVLVATSQNLSPQKCRNIENRITELGFESAHHPYTRQAIANRLYHDSRWLKELLGLSGIASALSRVPKFVRPLRDLPLIGRQADLDWLRAAAGDRLIFGQPGVGKTFLCQELVNEGRALFAIDDDIDRLVNAIRDQQPTAIIIEDAHLRCSAIEALRHFREETHTEFAVIADSWPGESEIVRAAMGISDTQCREIRRVSGDAIVELANAAGVHGPNWLLHMLVRQSSGCPGRAAMLVHFSLTSSNLREVFFGKTLANWVRKTFAELIGNRALRILAAFAIGGERGVPIEVVAQVLGYPAGDVGLDMAQLALGGIVHQVDDRTLCVLPEPLRCELVCDYFFKQPVPLPLTSFLSRGTDRGEVCETLIGAQERGAHVSTEFIFDQLLLANNVKAWERFAWTGEMNARRTFDQLPKHLIQLAEPFLRFIPDLVIPRFLELSIDDERPLNAHPKHPLRLIGSWISSAEPGTGEPVRRRRVLWQALRLWIQTRPDHAVALRALRKVVSPSFEMNEQKPGSGQQFVMHFGAVTNDELIQIAELWPQILDTLANIEIVDWKPVFEAVDEWVYHGRVRVALSPEHCSTFDATVRMILPALAKLAKHRSGVLSTIRQRAGHAKITLDCIEIDEDYRRLYPDDPFDAGDGRERRMEEQKLDAVQLAREWLITPPAEVSSRLLCCIREAAQEPRAWPDYSTSVCDILAAEAPAVLSYLDALLADDAPAAVIRSFLYQAAAKQEPGWFDRAMTCLRRAKQATSALEILLSQAQPFAEEVEVEIVNASRRLPQIVENVALFARIPTHRLYRLLNDDDDRLLTATASGMWSGRDTSPIPSELTDLWRSAVLKSQIQDYQLCEMFQHDGALAFQWLRDRVDRESPRYIFLEQPLAVAVTQLSDAHRREILQSISTRLFDADQIVCAVIGANTELYQSFLADSSRKSLHLAPLRGTPNAQWAELARIALDIGHSPHALAMSPFRELRVFRGPIHQGYEERAEQWKPLTQHVDPRIQEIARIGIEECQKTAESWRLKDEADEFREMYS